MIYSMTGFGAGRAVGTNYSVSVELKSLNSRYLEYHFRMPSYYMRQEILLKNFLTSKLVRGKLTVAININIIGTEKLESAASINFDLVEDYYRKLTAIRQRLNLTEEVPLASLLTLPGVVSESNPSIDEEEWGLVMQATEQALNELLKSREAEGAALMNDLTQRADRVEQLLKEIEKYETGRVDTIKQRLVAQLRELSDTVSVNDERFQTELIYFLEKFDINEEKVRITAHLASYRNILTEPESQGRKLTFVVQELWREVNTLGVKAFDVDIQTLVVEMKEELEKAKEQLMNIL